VLTLQRAGDEIPRHRRDREEDEADQQARAADTEKLAKPPPGRLRTVPEELADRIAKDAGSSGRPGGRSRETTTARAHRAVARGPSRR
jgi:hypothetical protein